MNKGPRDDRWYLNLMAPNTKGDKFAWLDPTSIYINERAFHDLLDDLVEDLKGIKADVAAGLDAMGFVLGAALAANGRRVLIATTGHDDRLAWMLGADALTDARQQVGESLWIQRLVAQTCIREYGGMVIHSQRVSSAVFDNSVVRRLMRAIPGLDDFSLLGKAWHEAVRARGQVQVQGRTP